MADLVKIARLSTYRYLARFRQRDGVIVEVDLTEAEYRALAVKGAGLPPRKGVPANADCLFAADAVMYDTPDGKLPLGGYDVRRDRILLGLGELNPAIVRGTEQELLTADREFTIDGKRWRVRAGTIEAVR